jgi:hypothetical protein
MLTAGNMFTGATIVLSGEGSGSTFFVGTGYLTTPSSVQFIERQSIPSN